MNYLGKRQHALVGLVAVVVAVSLTLISLEGKILLPIEGITAPLRRQIRRSIHGPRHSTAKLVFLAKKDRQRLLDNVARDNKRTRPAPPRTNGVVAAFYAPWQETGLNSLRANAKNITHVLPSWVHLTGDGKGLDFRDWYPDSVPHNNDVLKIARESNLKIVPVFQNAQIGTSGSRPIMPLGAWSSSRIFFSGACGA